MANRRMFSKKICRSAKFLKMPSDSHKLYLHLVLDADDDGVVEAYSVMQAVSVEEQYFNILVEKGYIKVLNDDLVSYIMDWREHNVIRADRKVDSIYKDLLLEAIPGIKLVEPKKRASGKKKTSNQEKEDITMRTRDLNNKIHILETVKDEFSISDKVDFIRKHFDEYNTFIGDHIGDMEYLLLSQRELKRPVELISQKLLETALCLYK